MWLKPGSGYLLVILDDTIIVIGLDKVQIKNIRCRDAVLGMNINFTELEL